MHNFEIKGVGFFLFSQGAIVVSAEVHKCGCCGRSAYVFVSIASGSHCLGCQSPAAGGAFLSPIPAAGAYAQGAA